MLKGRREALRERFQNLKENVVGGMSVETGGIRSALSSWNNNNNNSNNNANTNNGSGSEYTLGDHKEYLHIHKQQGAGDGGNSNSSTNNSNNNSPDYYYADVSHLLYDSCSIPGLVKDFSSPMETYRLNELYYGLEEMSGMILMSRSSTTGSSSDDGSPSKHNHHHHHHHSAAAAAASNHNHNKNEPLPVRTMTMRLSPEVMTAVVLDAVHEACDLQQSSSGGVMATVQVLKRLQGVFQCLLVPEEECQGQEGQDTSMTTLPFVLDARVCTQKTGNLDRILLIRIFYADHHTTNSNNNNNNNNNRSSPSASSPQKAKQQQSAKQIRDQAIAMSVGEAGQQNSMLMMMSPINLHLRSAAAFLQYFRKQQQQQQQQQSQQQSPLKRRLSPRQQPPQPGRLLSHNATMAIPSPRESPKASTAFFMGSFEPTFSVQLHKDLPHVTPQDFFPSLNSDDWSMLQSSWTLLSSIWRSLTEHHCLFHNTATTTDNNNDQGGRPYHIGADSNNNSSSSNSMIVLDLHYCSQIRQIARDNMLAQVQDNFQEIQTNLEQVERRHQTFMKILQRAHLRYRMPKLENTATTTTTATATNSSSSSSSPPKLKAPSHVPPAGYVDLAATVCKCVMKQHQQKKNKESADVASSASPPPSSPASTSQQQQQQQQQQLMMALYDDAVVKVYKTFYSQDDHNSRKHLKDSNATVMKRLVEIQATQAKLLQEMEGHVNTETAAKLFGKQARLATNSQGRVERLLRARVPLMEFELIGGKCQITATNMLCIKNNDRVLFGAGSDQYTLFDLKAIAFQIASANCLVVVSSLPSPSSSSSSSSDPQQQQPQQQKAARETLYKLHTSTDLMTLVQFIKALQALQGALEGESNNPYYGGDIYETSTAVDGHHDRVPPP